MKRRTDGENDDQYAEHGVLLVLDRLVHLHLHDEVSHAIGCVQGSGLSIGIRTGSQFGGWELVPTFILYDIIFKKNRTK